MITTKLPKIVLRSTPRRLAIRYLQWLWNLPRREPNQLHRWLKEMQDEIRTLVPTGREADDYYRKAESHFFFLLDLYTSAITAWIHDICLLVPLCRAAYLCVDGGPLVSPDLRSHLGRRLIEQYNLFVVQSIAFEKIQRDYLRGFAPPWLIPFVTELMSLEVAAGLLITRTSMDCDPELRQAEAESEVESLRTFARLSACAGSCSRNTRCLLEAAKMLGHCMNDSQLATQMITAKLEDQIRPWSKHSGATQSRKRRAIKKTQRNSESKT